MWDWFIDFLAWVLQVLADFCGDWGLAVILLTFIVRLLLMPLTVRSLRSNAKMQAMQPRIQQIQEMYANDPQRQQEELRNIYLQTKVNPLGGCLPLILQMPIFFALFSVLRDRIPETAHFYGILDSLSQSVSGSIASVGIAASWVFILLDILFGLLTLLPMLLQSKNVEGAQRTSQLIMGVVMAGMMLWFGWNVPAGVLLYYDTSAIWQVVQQLFITNRVNEQAKAEAEAQTVPMAVQVNVERRVRKKRQHKKG